MATSPENTLDKICRPRFAARLNLLLCVIMSLMACCLNYFRNDDFPHGNNLLGPLVMLLWGVVMSAFCQLLDWCLYRNQ